MMYPFDVYFMPYKQMLAYFYCVTYHFILPIAYIILFINAIKIILWFSKQTFKPTEQYNLKLNTAKDFYYCLVKLFLILLVIFMLFFLRISRVGHSLDILYYKEILEIVYYIKTTMPLLVNLLAFSGFIFCFIIFRIFLIFILYQIKVLFITLHIFFLHIDYYNITIRFRVEKVKSAYFMGFYKMLKTVLKNQELALRGFDIINIIELLENYIFKFLLLYLYIFDWITNFGQITTIFYILPYYFLYGIIRIFCLTWNKWFSEIAYINLTQHFYGHWSKENKEYKKITNVIDNIINLFILLIVLFSFMLFAQIL